MGMGVVSRALKKQHVLSLSTTEVEYIVTTFCVCQCIWFRRILEHNSFQKKKVQQEFYVITVLLFNCSRISFFMEGVNTL